ncbi:unnamed protein product, partial [Lymnaea stagnalis]
CPPFTYGIDCDQNCTCEQENTLHCNSKSGECTCKGGWMSERCEVDINECDEPNICPDVYSHCNNTPGNFSCDC